MPFYTLADAVQYITDNIASGVANIEMLTDYLMPAEDIFEIPASAHITLTTATTGSQRYDGTGRAVINRSNGQKTRPVITNHGELILRDITLDGKSIGASAPMIQSNGNLTVQRGTTLKNAINSGNGGAISATGNVSFVTSENVYLQGNKALNGGLLYYAGTGQVTVSGRNISGRN